MIVNIKGDKNIQVGDIVEFQGRKCILTYYARLEYPWLLINLDDFIVVNGFSNFEALKGLCSLICKNKDLVLTTKSQIGEEETIKNEL